MVSQANLCIRTKRISMKRCAHARVSMKNWKKSRSTKIRTNRFVVILSFSWWSVNTRINIKKVKRKKSWWRKSNAKTSQTFPCQITFNWRCCSLFYLFIRVDDVVVVVVYQKCRRARVCEEEMFIWSCVEISSKKKVKQNWHYLCQWSCERLSNRWRDFSIRDRFFKKMFWS